jgi:hypothetical protein
MTPKDLLGAGVAALTVLGALIFGAQRIAYERFYDQFGITPEDVGVDVTRVLTQTASGLAVWLALMAAGAGLIGVVLLMLSGPGSFAPHGKSILIAGFGLSVCFAALMFFLNAADADDAARCAARPDGQSVRGLRVLVPFGPPVTRLGIRAERAVIRSTDATSAPAWDRSQVVYLGAANGVSIVYDPQEKRTMSLPTSSVVISIETTSERYHPQQGCQPLGSS